MAVVSDSFTVTLGGALNTMPEPMALIPSPTIPVQSTAVAAVLYNLTPYIAVVSGAGNAPQFRYLPPGCAQLYELDPVTPFAISAWLNPLSTAPATTPTVLVTFATQSVDELASTPVGNLGVTGVNTTVAVTNNLVVVAAAPANPTTGQQYFDSTLDAVGTYNGTAWVYQYTPNPAGRVYATSALVISAAAVSVVQAPMASSFLQGGMTETVDGSIGLTVPDAGIYSVRLSLNGYNNTVSAALQLEVRNGAGTTAAYTQAKALGGAALYVSPVGADLIQCVAGDTLRLWGEAAGSGWTWAYSTYFNYLSAVRVA
jgi:hypothetical protein